MLFYMISCYFYEHSVTCNHVPHGTIYNLTIT
nr:MAG TPA: UPF0271 protein [Inoviridae sp.]